MLSMGAERPPAISIIVPAARQLSITWKHVLSGGCEGDGWGPFEMRMDVKLVCPLPSTYGTSIEASSWT
jgi:hypothetical protein